MTTYSGSAGSGQQDGALTDWRDVETMPTDGYSGPFLVYWPERYLDNSLLTFAAGGYSVAWFIPSADGWTFCAQSVHARRDYITKWAPITPPVL